MIAFVVKRNRKGLETLGLEGQQTWLSVSLNSEELEPAEAKLQKRPRRAISISLGGVSILSDGSRESVTWTTKGLKVGDTLSIKIVSRQKVDPPLSIQRISKAEVVATVEEDNQRSLRFREFLEKENLTLAQVLKVRKRR
jgi:hypothetical protein